MHIKMMEDIKALIDEYNSYIVPDSLDTIQPTLTIMTHGIVEGIYASNGGLVKYTHRGIVCGGQAVEWDEVTLVVTLVMVYRGVHPLTYITTVTKSVGEVQYDRRTD